MSHRLLTLFGSATTLSSPLDNPGCIFWVPPNPDSFRDDSGGLIADTELVGTWLDSSGNGNNATMTASSSAPSYQTNIQNSLPMVLFDGVDNILNCNGVATSLQGEDTPYTIAMVFKKVGNVGIQVAFGVGRTVSTNPFIRVGTTTNSFLVGRRDDATGGAGDEDAGGAVGTSPRVFAVRYNGTTVDAYTENTLILNAVAQNVGVLTLNIAALGALPRAAPVNFFNGYLGEVILYNSALSDTRFVNTINYLRLKWAI